MKRYIDLQLNAPISDQTKTERMIETAAQLGYSLLAIPTPPDITKKQVDVLKQICSNHKLDLATRVNLSPRTPKELLQNLRKLRRKFEIIAVKCHTKDVARQAAKDRRVDLLQFPATDPRRRFFDDAEAELASQALSALEIELVPLLQLNSSDRIRLLSALRREVATATRFKVPVTLSSGATDELLMRGPHEYAALATLFDFPFFSALQALSETPKNIVERNRKKLSPCYVAPGIYVVGKGTDD